MSRATWRHIVARTVTVLVLLVVVAGGVLYWMGTREDEPTRTATVPLADPAQRVAYGAYLARIGDCAACHTARGGASYAGGAAIPSPFGTFYGPNITPDLQTGIGDWSADDFWRALHHGKRPDGQLLYPAFPYTEYTHVTRTDADALYAYLRSLPAVRQENRPHELAFPYDQRYLLAFWRALHFKPVAGADSGAIAPPAADSSAAAFDSNAAGIARSGTVAAGGVPAQDAAAASSPQASVIRGRYLVEGLGHCVACHAPRNALGATTGTGLPGGEIPGLGWYGPSLHAGPAADGSAPGLAQWTAADIAALLRDGVSPHGSASGPMAEVVTGGTQYLRPADALAIADYLKSLPAAAVPNAPPPGRATLQRGEKLYGTYCVACHQSQGEGRPPAWPPLAGNISVTAPSPQNAIRVVLQGGFAPATAANPQPHGMPPFGQVMNDDDVAAVVSYIRNQWGNQAGGVTALQVKRAR
ncbi:MULTISPECIES: cytochrome c [unclassified Achromobacter]|uniref:c-type cytochrome n=1 Tax=unclassified Achromobacter TaxID=2626865 RepID=UPI000B51A6D6|nr:MULTISPECIES: cytochrome c [unclassified Achromobacter]OWT74588.1 alcohol dehydrogenase [Achromobacter sp. HZ34]OWT79055.1 alcohol dehydrogenase [Achromobacter sp. HZ28]